VLSGTTWTVTTIAGLSGNAGAADGTNATARFNYPNSITMDASGNLYVADYSNQTIRQLTQVGTNWVVKTIAAGLSGPLGIAVDSSGNVLVSENFDLRKITPAGTNWVVTTITGVSMFQPNALIVDPTGTIYVTATMANVIRAAEPLYKLDGILRGGQLVLSWPAAASNYVLQTTSSLISPLWNPVTNGVFNSADGFVLTNDLFGQSQFFRLGKQ